MGQFNTKKFLPRKRLFWQFLSQNSSPKSAAPIISVSKCSKFAREFVKNTNEISGCFTPTVLPMPKDSRIVNHDQPRASIRPSEAKARKPYDKTEFRTEFSRS